MFGGSDTKILLIVIIRLASLYFYDGFFRQNSTDNFSYLTLKKSF